MSTKFIRFSAVGLAAAGVHVTVVVALVELAGIRPSVANVIAWFVAVGISFLGQRFLTFQPSGAIKAVELVRFVIVAALVLSVNQGIFLLLLKGLNQHYFVALVVAVFIAAMFSYTITKHWVFRARQ